MTDINPGAILEALNDKEDRNQRNVDISSGADAVIEYQVPTAENDYTWYRKYASGWVEQGGHTTNTTITLPITMADTNYSVSMTQLGGVGSSSYTAQPENFTTTGFTYRQFQSVYDAFWEVKGMAAS